MTQNDEPAPAPVIAPADSDRTSAPMVRADLVAAVVFIIFGALVLYGSWTMPRLEVRRIHPLTIPGLVPGLLSLALIACGVILAIRSLRARAIGGWQVLGEALVADAEADATPQPRGVELLGEARDVREAALFVIGEDVERTGRGHLRPRPAR